MSTQTEERFISKSLDPSSGSSKDERFGRDRLAAGIVHIEGLSEAQSRRIVQFIIDQIGIALISGEAVYLPRLGKIYAVYMQERQGVHPRTLERMTVAPSVHLRIKQSAPLKRELLNHIETFKTIADRKAALAAEQVEAERLDDETDLELEDSFEAFDLPDAFELDETLIDLTELDLEYGDEPFD